MAHRLYRGRWLTVNAPMKLVTEFTKLSVSLGVSGLVFNQNTSYHSRLFVLRTDGVSV